jgi:hypothetical protein
MAFGPHANQERRHSRAQLAPERTQAFRAGLVQAFRDRRQAVQECWHFTNAGILRRHFHVSYVMCPCHVSGVMCHASYHVSQCHMSYIVSCVRCHVLLAYVMRHVCHVSIYMSCRVPYVMVYVSYVSGYMSCSYVMSHLSCWCHVSYVLACQSFCYCHVLSCVVVCHCLRC